MRSLGIDLGGSRTGVAISDPGGILASPLTVLTEKDDDALIEQILKLVEQYKAERIVVGLPRLLNGRLGKQADKVTTFTDKLSSRARQSAFHDLDVQLWDERLSTQAAERLKKGPDGRKGGSRSRAGRKLRDRSFSAKAQVDAIAAAFILQGFLDRQREAAEIHGCSET